MTHMFLSITGAIFITAFGIFIFLKPDLLWKITEQWKSRYADEPSDFYLKNAKLGGAIFTIVGVIGIILLFIPM